MNKIVYLICATIFALYAIQIDACPLCPKGEEEVTEAGKLIKAAGIKPEVAHTSLLRRTMKT